VRAALALAALLWAAPAAADECEDHVQYAHATLNRGARLANNWNNAWQMGMAAVTVGQMAAIPLVGKDDRIDLYLGAASSLAGLISLAAMPPAVINDAPRFEAHLNNPDRCALAHEGDIRLARGAASEREVTGVFAHIGNIAFNLGLGAVLGFGFHHWLSAGINVAVGTAVGEALILTYPKTLQALAPAITF
jgi:hypothetical protein